MAPPLRVAAALISAALAAAALASASPASTQRGTGGCGFVSVGGHKYIVLALGTSCAQAIRVARLEIRLKPIKGSKNGRLPGPAGYKCAAHLGPGNIQFSGGCTNGKIEILWNRA